MEPMVDYKSTLNRKEIDLFLDAEESPVALMKRLLDRVLLSPATPLPQPHMPRNNVVHTKAFNDYFVFRRGEK